MPSQAEKKKAALLKQLDETREAGLEGAQPLSEDRAKIVAASSPPLIRDKEHQAPIPEGQDVDPDVVQPDLTNTSMAEVEADFAEEVTVKHGSGKKGADSTEETVRLDEVGAEGLSDKQLKDAGVLDEPKSIIHPARLAPDSERPRTPLQRSPAAGPGSWPVPEDSMPAVMPSDPPVDEREEPGDRTFEKIAGITVRKGGDIDVRSTRAGNVTLTVPSKSVSAAAALYLKLRNQFPHFTQEQLQDEFHLQLESMLGVTSPHGQTAAGDERGEAKEERPGELAQAAVDDLVENTSEATLRAMYQRLVDEKGADVSLVKLDSDKAEIARLIIAAGGPLPEPSTETE